MARDSTEEYFIDEDGRIRINNTEVISGFDKFFADVKISDEELEIAGIYRGNFDDAIERNFNFGLIQSVRRQPIIPHSDLYIEDAVSLITGINCQPGLSRFEWLDNSYFVIRPVSLSR
jgi:hypothetical protein